MTAAFEGVKVVELAGMVSGPYCGKLLADMGADVMRIEEPPAGDPARMRGAFPDGKPDPECSALFLNLNTSKRSLALDLAKRGGRETFERLIDWADVLIVDRTSATFDGIARMDGAARAQP